MDDDRGRGRGRDREALLALIDNEFNGDYALAFDVLNKHNSKINKRGRPKSNALADLQFILLFEVLGILSDKHGVINFGYNSQSSGKGKFKNINKGYRKNTQLESSSMLIKHRAGALEVLGFTTQTHTPEDRARLITKYKRLKAKRQQIIDKVLLDHPDLETVSIPTILELKFKLK